VSYRCGCKLASTVRDHYPTSVTAGENAEINAEVANVMVGHDPEMRSREIRDKFAVAMARREAWLKRKREGGLETKV